MVRRAFLTLLLSGVVLALPVPASAGGGGCYKLTQGAGTTVKLRNFCITPTLLRVEPGETVTFVNQDSFRHIITSAGVEWSSDGYLRANEAFTATFRKDGVYPYQCYLHPGMAGAVIVGDATGLGAADRGGVFVAPFEGEEPLPEIVYVTRAPEPGATSSSSGGPVALVGGVLLGVAIGAIVTLGVRGSASRRRLRDVTS
jgi:plastocyanin